MKRFLIAAAMAMGTLPTFAADVGVSVSVGQPGFYGRIDIGNFPQPQVIYPQPVVIQPVPVGVVRQPIYLRIPPGHEKNWRKHCARYNACGQPVYFVHDTWYREVYAPHFRDRGEERGRGDERGERHGRGHEKGHGKGRD